MNHCKKDFAPADVWYLKDIYWGEEKIINRELHIGYCPNCNSLVATRIETRESDKVVFHKTEIKAKAKGLMKKEKPRKSYTREEFTSKSNYPKCDWTFGKNTSLTNQSGDTTQIRHHACNYASGKSKMITKIKFNVKNSNKKIEKIQAV